MNEQLFICAVIMAFLLLVKIIVNLKPHIKKTKPKLPSRGYSLIYSDQKTNRLDDDAVIYSKLLVSEEYGLIGKPDFVYRDRRGGLLPVELKSGTIGDAPEPYEGDLMQLAAYFLILEEVYDVRPKNGRLIYNDFMFIVRNSYGLRRRLLLIAEDMRDMLETGEQAVEPSFAKCRYCICRDTVCEYNTDTQ